ncbi:MAG: type II toxin-antitoxin system ParD family antitoxin [Bacteroidota bacterium]
MHISLTPELKKIVKEKVESGMYGNASEVIRDAIRQMNHYDQLLYSLKKERLLQMLEDGKRSGISDLTVSDIVDQEKNIK